MLHHISFGVSDIERSAAFYDAALAPLGYIRVWEDLRPGEADQAVGYGIAGGGDKFAIKFRPEDQRARVPAFIWPSLPRADEPSPIFMRRRSRTEASITGRLVFVPTTGHITSRPSW